MGKKILILLLVFAVFVVQVWSVTKLGLKMTLSPIDRAQDVVNQPISDPLIEKRVVDVERLGELPPAKMIGQLLLVAPDGLILRDEERLALREGSISGMFLLGKNVVDAVQVASLSAAIYAEASSSGLVPFVAVDQEGGLVSRIKWVNDTGPFEIESDVEAFNVAKERGLALAELGFNMNFAPVGELAATDSAFIALQRRAFGSSDEMVSSAVGYSAVGIIPVVKHFPGGLGRVSEDPHLVMPKLVLNADELAADLDPFIQAIAAGVKFVMVTHIIYPEYDADPASASDYFLRTLLRDQLGFEGVVVIDDLAMGAVVNDYEVADYAVMSVRNGADILLVSRWQDYQIIYETLMREYQTDEQLRLRIDESARRIVTHKLENIRL